MGVRVDMNKEKSEKKNVEGGGGPIQGVGGGGG